MKKKKYRSIITSSVLAVTSVALLSGCRNLLVFSTATKFGLDISESAAQQPEITFGYNRAEVVSVPLGGGHTNTADRYYVSDAGPTNDAYSVLGTFSVGFDPSLNNTAGIHVNDLFATGVAAQKAAASPAMGGVFATNLIFIINSKATNTIN